MNKLRLFLVLVGTYLCVQPSVHTQVATHYVSSTGSAVSSCTIGDPCTLTRAVALINASTINDGDIVEMAAGRYGQATLNITGSGSVGLPITIRGAALDGTSYLFPGREILDAATCSLTSGRTFTYECPFDEVAKGYTPNNVTQDRPATWDPFTVLDENDVTFEMNVPPKYKVVASVALVEAQHCTSFFSTAANLMYIHPCDDLSVDATDAFWFNSSNYGTMDVDGDYITLDGLGFDRTSNGGYGLIVDNSADNFIGRNLIMNASAVNGQGTNGLFDNIHVQSTGQQGSPGVAPCFSDNANGLTGSCWDDSGSGNAAVFDAGGPWTLSNSIIENGWNGISCGGTGTVTITGNNIRNFPNHPFGCEGDGRTITYNIILNNQEAFFSNISTTDMDNIVIEHNLMFGTALMWGGGTNTNWTVRYNIFRRIRVDNTTEATGIFDCNLYIQPTDDPLIFDRGGAGDPTQADYDTVAQIQAGIPGFETNGVSIAAANATNGTQFTLFTIPSALYDFTPVLAAQSISMPAPCGAFVGPLNIGDGGEPEVPVGNRRPLIRLRRL